MCLGAVVIVAILEPYFREPGSLAFRSFAEQYMVVDSRGCRLHCLGLQLLCCVLPL